MKRIFLFAFILLLNLTIRAQAKLIVENNSRRIMTVKVMEKNVYGSDVYRYVNIEAYGKVTVDFSYSGSYFLKIKAYLSGSDPVYQKSDILNIVNDSSGYSVMTMSFTITESKIPKASGGKNISKKEFDEN